MPNISVCLPMLYSKLDKTEHFRLAHEAGARFVEFWNWTAYDTDFVRSELDKYSLKLTAMCVDGTGEAAERFKTRKLLWRDGIEDFVEVTRQSIEVAKKLGRPSLIITVGQERNDVTRYEQHANIVLSLRAVAPMLEEAGITMVVEPLNVLVNHRGYFLPSSYEGFEILEEVGSPNIKLLYDIYHQQISEGNLIPTITKNIGLIGHFHVADNPGRNQPGTGEINYKKIFEVIDSLGYDKYVGLEYRPTIDVTETIRDVMELAK